MTALEYLLNDFGEQLITNAIMSAIFHVHGSLVRDMAEIVWSVGNLSKTV